MFVVAPQHPFARRKEATAKELLSEPFVLRKVGSGTRQIAERVLLDAGISPGDLTIALETNSNDAIRGAVKQGTGIGVLSQAAAQDDIARGRLIAVSVNGVRARLNTYLLTDPKRIPTPAVAAFLAFLK